MTKFLKYALMLVLLAGFTACDKGNGGTDNPSGGSVTIVLDKQSVNLQIGEQTALVATVTPAEKQAALTWLSTDESVATVKDGVITAVAKGTATIYALIGEVEASCDVSVTDSPVKSITLDKTELALFVGDTATLTATVEPESAAALAIDWFSSNEEIASVNSKGEVTAIKAGTVTITAKIESVEAKCSVTISN